jgi:hypothetical protein
MTICRLLLFLISLVHVYTEAYSEDVCMQCAANMYCTNTSTYPCPAYSNSTVGSASITDCVCQAGYTGVNSGECTACTIGTYKELSGNNICSMCGENTYSDTPGAVNCTMCHTNAYSLKKSGSDTRNDCVCGDGYTQTNSSECTTCGAGTHKTWNGNEPCTACGANTYSSELGARSADTCTACPQNSESLSGSTSIEECLCNPGYDGVAGSGCTECATGTYKDMDGGGDCSPCPSSRYSDTTAATVCSYCAIHAYSAPGSTHKSECMCIPGYNGTGWLECTACVEGTYSSGAGMAACTRCPAANMVSPVQSTSIQNCSCKTGYIGDYTTGCMIGVETTTHAPTETTTTPAPTETATTARVEFTVSMEMLVADFGSYLRGIFIQGVADALDVDSVNVAIASVTQRQESTQHRLLHHNATNNPTIDVRTVATVQSTRAGSVATSVESQELTTGLASQGFSVHGVSSPVVTRTTPPPKRNMTRTEHLLLSYLSRQGSCSCTN